ncbi:prepilin-type N-terminal cleavage/methylation domain-containing protein [Neptuniibacter sp.]|uniref:type II secretion system protein n=1 Tax=Neptuniibacter sp. TaxID=1962643 RepID=UPI00262314D2|nr:prepilin-type N-terminal cleavage/methylation domain-containing protein [Neptuniibacter sp.]MCP4595128.1 type II secretion system protein [Neptuniibacter sp.]
MKISNKKQKGFTLVEMAIVLVIIGLILGAVSIGKNLQRDAENQKVYQKFVAAWKQVYDQYYQRTGVVLGDSQVAPTYMVNGDEAEPNFEDGAKAGLPSEEAYDNTGRRICHGQGYAAGDVGEGDPQLAVQDLHDLIDRIGLRMPPGRAEGQEDRYLYLDSNGNPAEIQICFQWNPDKTISGAGNVMVVRGLTPDLARTLDQLVDGKPDALEGRFRQQNAALNSSGDVTSQQPGVQWAANNTYEQGTDNTAGAETTGDNQDENRIILVTAHWIMDQ